MVTYLCVGNGTCSCIALGSCVVQCPVWVGWWLDGFRPVQKEILRVGADVGQISKFGFT